MAARPAGDVRPVVEARTVRRAFGRTVVLDGVDLTIAAGEVVALLGASGSGKSTLLRVLAGLYPDATGDITTTGSQAVVFQEHRLLPWKRVADNVGLGLSGSDVHRRVTAALDEVGLADRHRAWPAELSGGQAQRVAFARALGREPALLLADRTVVLDGGRIAEDAPVPLEHPRAPDDPGFGPLRRHLLQRLGVATG